MIELRDLTLRQGAFSLEMDFSLAKGRRLAVVGASGAGKSTLLNLTAGFQQPDTGRVWIDGKDVTDDPVAARGVNILFQDGNLFPHLTVRENVSLGMRTSLRLAQAEQQAVGAALEEVGLIDFIDRRPAELSGGQAARVALARTLIRDRPVLLLDEPFAALDPTLRQDMAELVQRLCERHDRTLVIVAHDLRGLGGLATDLCLMEDGRIVAMGDAEALRHPPPDALRPWL